MIDTWHYLMTETGLPTTACLIALMLIAGYLIRALTRQETPAWPSGQDDTRSDSQPSPSPSMAAPVTYASRPAQPQPITLSPAVRAAVMRSRTYGQPTGYATADEATAASNGSGNATARTSFIPNNRRSSGISLIADPLDTSRRPERFFPTKKNAADQEKSRNGVA